MVVLYRYNFPIKLGYGKSTVYIHFIKFTFVLNIHVFKTGLLSLSPSQLNDYLNSEFSIWMYCQPCWPHAPGGRLFLWNSFSMLESEVFFDFFVVFFKVFSK